MDLHEYAVSVCMPGIETDELDSWQENGEDWRCLKVTFPERIATHSAEQTYYFDRHGLLKRHDYDVDVKHTIFPRQPDGKPAPASVVVSIDISDIEFS